MWASLTGAFVVASWLKPSKPIAPKRSIAWQNLSFSLFGSLQTRTVRLTVTHQSQNNGRTCTLRNVTATDVYFCDKLCDFALQPAYVLQCLLCLLSHDV